MRYQITPPLVLVHVNSYHCRGQIKALGGRWQPEDKGWLMPTQEAYDKAFELCENVDEEFDNRSAYYDQDSQYPDTDFGNSRDKLILPLKENVGKPIRSGQRFYRGNNAMLSDNEWIVVSKIDEWQDGQFKIICEHLKLNTEMRMGEDEIRLCPWGKFDPEEAKVRFDRRKSKSIW